MTGFLTPQQLADRTTTAIDAAVTAGRRLGLTITEPRVLHDLFSVVVHLQPSPVVARVPAVITHGTDLAAQAHRQQAELDVTSWLAQHATPVIAPSPLVPREPVTQNGLSMTMWQYVEHEPDREPDYAVNAERTADLHAALRSYPGRVSFLSAAEPQYVSESLAALEGSPELLVAEDLDRARREWQLLEPLVRSRAAFTEAFGNVELQPLHGDSPPANIVDATDGHRYADFEMLTFGPVEWDLAGVGPELEAAYDRGARRIGLRPLREDVLRFVNEVGMLRVVATLALAPQLPVLMQYLQPAVDQWRTRPFARAGGS